MIATRKLQILQFGNFGNLQIFAKVANFCACYSAPRNTLFLHVRLFFFLMSEIPPEEDALNELVATPDDDAADSQKKPKLNHDAKTTPEAHTRQFKQGLFGVRGKTMWCNMCDKPVQHERKCIAVKLIESVAHRLHGTGGALTSTSFDMCATLFASLSLLHAQRQAGRRRRWFALLQSKGILYPQRWGPPDGVHGEMPLIGGVQMCTCGRNLWL